MQLISNGQTFAAFRILLRDTAVRSKAACSSPAFYGRGYLDAFMDWRLLYRGADELRALFPAEVRGNVQTSIDPHGNGAYAVVARRWLP